MAIGILFNGQGSQRAGMGKDFYDAFPYVREMYDEASSVLGYDLRQLIDSEHEKLNDTLYTQPAILVVSLTIAELVKREYGLNPLLGSGFSLGEYSALGASGTFSFQDILFLIKERARLMEEASLKAPGKMAAVIGMESDELLSICERISDESGFVTIANYNCPGQLVVSGHQEKVDALEQELKGIARRFIPVQVSGAFHTKLMKPVAEPLGEAIDQTTINNPDYPIVMNVHAKPANRLELKELMMKQVYSPVLYEQTIRYMIDEGIDTFVEIGPGKVLSGFVRRIDRTKKVISIDQVDDLKQLESGV